MPNAANFNLLDVAGIDTDSSDGVSAPIILADLAAGTLFAHGLHLTLMV